MIKEFLRDEIGQMPQRYRAQFINSLSGYKSLQMVATQSPDGKANIGIFNSIFHIGANPPLIGMIVRPDSLNHDTLNNIRSTKQYTLNNVRPSYYRKAHQTSARYPSGESEFERCGLAKVYRAPLSAPFVAESSIQLGMILREIVPLTINATTLVIGEIVLVSLDDEFIADDGYVDPLLAETVTVAGLDSYFTAEALARLPYAKPDQEPSS